MVLKLKWKDYKDIIYTIGLLTYDKGKYYFRVNEKEYKSALDNGCEEAGYINLDKKYYVSDELFPFFQDRIPNKNRKDIKEILDKFNLSEYDEMMLLKKTKGMLITDRFFIE